MANFVPTQTFTLNHVLELTVHSDTTPDRMTSDDPLFVKIVWPSSDVTTAVFPASTPLASVIFEMASMMQLSYRKMARIDGALRLALGRRRFMPLGRVGSSAPMRRRRVSALADSDAPLPDTGECFGDDVYLSNTYKAAYDRLIALTLEEREQLTKYIGSVCPTEEEEQNGN